MLITILSFVLVLGVLVFFHELGHYWVARRNGIVVEEFGMGYPPRLAKLFRYDGTDFTINLIPFGGFARMKGEDASDMSPGSFNAASRSARAATLVAGPFMNALLAVVLFAASFMAGFPAVVGHPLMTTVAAGSTAAALGLQANDVLLDLNGQPVRVSAIPDFKYDLLHKEENDPSLARLTVYRAGKNVELPLDHPISQEELLNGANYVPVMATEVTGVAKESPAEAAGIQAGDLIYSVNDTVVSE